MFQGGEKVPARSKLEHGIHNEHWNFAYGNNHNVYTVEVFSLGGTYVRILHIISNTTYATASFSHVL